MQRKISHIQNNSKPCYITWFLQAGTNDIIKDYSTLGAAVKLSAVQIQCEDSTHPGKVPAQVRKLLLRETSLQVKLGHGVRGNQILNRKDKHRRESKVTNIFFHYYINNPEVTAVHRVIHHIFEPGLLIYDQDSRGLCILQIIGAKFSTFFKCFVFQTLAFEKGFANKKVTECNMVDKVCNINKHNVV